MAKDILGLGGPEANTKNLESTPTSSSRTSDRDARRRRMSEGADEVTPEPTGLPHGSGATGIDMGSGGEGTDIE